MRIFITGSNGFIGRNLKEYFENKHTVICPKRQQLNLLDTQAVYNFLSENPVDVLIHCAANIYSLEENLLMYYNLERCEAFFDKFVHVGSGCEYDLKNYIPMMREEYFGTHIPTDVNGLSKYTIARHIESKSEKYYNLRPFGVYGKYENYHRRFISNNICRVLCGLDISINRNMLLDYLYIGDFCRAMEMFLEKDGKHRSYNVCSARPVELLELAKIIQEIDGTGKRIIIKEEGMKPEYSGDNSRFLQEFGEYRLSNLKETIVELYHWYKNGIDKVFDSAAFRQECLAASS